MIIHSTAKICFLSFRLQEFPSKFKRRNWNFQIWQILPRAGKYNSQKSFQTWAWNFAGQNNDGFISAIKREI